MELLSASQRSLRSIFTRITLALTIVGLFGVALTFIGAPAAQASPNPQMNFQGRLLTNTGALVPDGNYNIEFKIYTGGNGCVGGGSSPCSGTNVWTEDWYNNASNGVIVKNGYFSAALGSITSLNTVDFNNSTLWLSMSVGGTTTGTPTLDGEMLPFKRLTSSPYAFNSAYLNGLASSAFAQLASANTFTAANLFSPGASAVVALTVKASTAGTANGLEVFDSSNTRQAFFNAAGQLNVGQLIQPTSNNAIDLGVVGAAFRNEYVASVDSGTTTTTLAVGTTNATSITIGRTGASLALESNSTLTIGNGATAHTISIGTGSAVQGITIGSTNSTSSTTIESGSGTLAIGNGATAHTIQIGTGAAVQGVTIGSTNSSSATTIQAGTAGITITSPQTRVGSIGTATGQVYVSGAVPSSTLSSTSLGNALHVAVSGRYAYAMTQFFGSTLQVYDVTRPSAPAALGSLSMGVSTDQIVAQGHYVYAASSGATALKIIDVSNPNSPSVASTTTLGSAAVNSIAVAGRYAYLVGGSSLYIVDISNPASPVVAGNATISSGMKGIAVNGKYAYMGNQTNDHVYVYDISNPASPSSVGSVTATGHDIQYITVQGRYVYATSFGSHFVDIVSVSNPASPAIVGSISTGTTNAMSGVVSGHFLYVGTDVGYKVIDITNPASPSVAGTFTGSDDIGDIGINGNYMYAVAYTSGKFLTYDLGGTYTQQLQAGSAEVSGLQVDNDATLLGNTTIQGGLAIGQSLQVATDIGVGGNVNAVSGYQFNGTAGSTTTCSSGNVLQNAVVQGGIITAGTCVANGGGVAPTLQDAYNNSSSPAVIAETSGKGIQIQDFSSTVGNILAVQSNAGSTTYFAVTNAGALTNSIDVVSGSTLTVANSASTHTISIGTGAAVQTISLGSTNSTSATTIESGSGTLAIGNGGTAHNIQIGTGAAVQGITIGSATSTSSTSIESGSGTLAIGNGATAHTIAIGTGAAVQGVSIGSTNSTSGTTIESGSNGLNIGNGATAHSINIGTGAAVEALSIGSTNSTSTTVIEGGSSATTSIAIGNGATAHTIKIGSGAAVQGVTIGSQTTTSTTVINGGTNATGAITANGSLTVQSLASTNSTSALLVQTASSDPVLRADTLTTSNLVSNPDFEVNTTGWTATSGITVTRSTTAGQFYDGIAGGVYTRTSPGTAQLTGFTTAITPGTYNYSFYLANNTTGGVGVSVAGGGSPTCTLSPLATANNAGFVRYSCSFTTSGTNVTDLDFTFVGNGSFDIDGVQLTSGATLLPYASPGALQLRGTISSPAIFKSSANSTNAFQIQNAAGTSNIFSVDTLNSRIGIGTATPGYALDVVGDINVSSAYRVGGTAGATTSACGSGQYLASQPAAGGIVTAGTCTTATLQNAYDNSSSPATILLADAKNFVITAADTSTDPNVLINLQCVTSCSTNGRFAVQNAGTDVFAVNPNGTILIGTSTNGVSFASGGEPTLNGTAQHIRRIRIAAEYPNSVLDTGATGNNTGTMTSGLDLTNRMNYYKWTTASGSNQSYDVVTQIPIPSDFAGWSGSTPFGITTYTSNTTNGTITVEVRKSNGSADSHFSSFQSATPGSTSTWTTTTFNLDSSNYTAGDYLTIRVRLQAPASGDTRAANITLDYLSKW